MVEETNSQSEEQGPEVTDAEGGGSVKEKEHYDVIFFHKWCKACGLCMALCPKELISADQVGKPVMSEPDRCAGCRFCEIHCPDFAITVRSRTPRRRKTDV